MFCTLLLMTYFRSNHWCLRQEAQWMTFKMFCIWKALVGLISKRLKFCIIVLMCQCTQRIAHIIWYSRIARNEMQQKISCVGNCDTIWLNTCFWECNNLNIKKHLLTLIFEGGLQFIRNLYKKNSYLATIYTPLRYTFTIFSPDFKTFVFAIIVHFPAKCDSFPFTTKTC